MRADGNEIQARRREALSGYPIRWKRMISEWKAPRADDAVWLMYSANYLFNTGGVKWAVDPVLLSNRVPEAAVPDVASDLADLDFVLLSHAHRDHCDFFIWSQLKKQRCRWIVPEHMLDFFERSVTVRRSCLTVAVPGKEIIVAGLRIVPFSAPHHEQLKTGEVNCVASTGYQVETPGGRTYLLPGDIRTYDLTCLETFTDVSAVFAHVFLGRSAALEGNPPLLPDFVDFYLSCRPRAIVLSHLYDFERSPEDCWVKKHALAARRMFRKADSGVKVEIPDWYERLIL